MPRAKPGLEASTSAAPRAEPPSAGRVSLFRSLFDGMVRLLAARNLRTDRFGTFAAILGVALGTATVNVVLVLDVSTARVEAAQWATNPDLAIHADTIALRGFRNGKPTKAKDLKEETHEDYQVMRSAIRLGSLSAFLVGALIVFFTFGVMVERRKREVALLRSLGALRAQVAAIFIREAIFVGAAGAVLGFLCAFPMAYLAAKVGITTTGRSFIPSRAVSFPVGRMLIVSLVGGGTALLGVLRPVRDLYRLDLAQTLRPRFDVQQGVRAAARRTSGVTLIALPFMLLVYILMRPFFRNALPSFTFFVLEAGFVCTAFLLTLVLVPELVRRGGGLLVRLLPRGPAAERLLTQRRIEHLGHELSWSVSGVMLVFALLLSLHVVTYALTAEVSQWAEHAIEPYAYLYTPSASREAPVIPPLAGLPPGVAEVRFTGRTPWPNPVYAADQADLARLAVASGRPDLVKKAGLLGPGKVLLSKMMARRLRVREGDELELSGRGGTARLAITAVTDDLGYVPMAGPYRNSKTYAILDSQDDALIAPYSGPLGSAVVLADTGRPGTVPAWRALFDRNPAAPPARMLTGLEFERGRILGTDNDFLVFDLILGLTSLLAAVGIANQMLLSIHARRRELALYRVLGMTARQVRRMILFEGAFIGLFGGGLAVLLGIPLGYAAIGALRAVSAFEVDFTLPPHYAVLTLLGAVGVALTASLYPASSAGRADSAESVHYE